MSKQQIFQNIDIFLCPVCGRKMKASAANAISCGRRHSFDLSRSGYVNLLMGSKKTDYDKRMLQSRYEICRSGFFEPMIRLIARLIQEESTLIKQDKQRLLDAGCGEGSHLAHVISELGTDNVTGFGADISKDGIQLASKNYPDIAWCVADLARLPFAGRQFDAVLSILSPSNYSEFKRLLSDRGLLIKVIPGGSYLKELRSYFYASTDKETYSNSRVIEYFKEKFDIIDIQELKYTVSIDNEQIDKLVKMTPLSWKAPVEKLAGIQAAAIDTITVDLTVIAGIKQKGAN